VTLCSRNSWRASLLSRLEEVCRLILAAGSPGRGSSDAFKEFIEELDLPVRFGSPWAWVDELFRDGDWRRSFKLEESHDDDTIVVRAELPGVNPDKDVVVEVVDNELVIRAQRSESHRSHDDHVYRSEIRYGSFVRSVPILPMLTNRRLKRRTRTACSKYGCTRPLRFLKRNRTEWRSSASSAAVVGASA